VSEPFFFINSPQTTLKNNMAYKSLNEFIKELDRQGELIRIKELVNPELEAIIGFFSFNPK